MKLTTTHRLFLILLCFSFISKTVFSLEQSIDLLNIKNIDSLSVSGVLQKDSTKAEVLFKDSTIDKIKRSIDSLNDLSITIKHRLDSFPNLRQDTLLSFRNQLVNAQETASYLAKIVNNQTETESLGIINGINDIYFKIGNLKARVDERIRKQDNLAIKQKAGYIWTAPIIANPQDLFSSLKSEIINPIQTLFQTHSAERGGLFLLILLSIGYFYWVLKNRQVFNPTRIKLPVWQSILFFFTLFPLFDRGITANYIAFILSLILLLSFLKFRKLVNIQSKRWWGSLLVIFVLILLFNYLLVSNSLIIRIIAIGLNLVALIFGYRTVDLLKHNNNYPRIYRSLFALYIILNVFSILLNVVGQINISKNLSITAFGGIVQLVGLIILGRIVIEDFNKQFEAFKKSKRFLANLNKANTLSFIHKVLFIIGSILWLTVFLINLNIVESTIGFLSTILNKPHSFGSISFTLGNVIISVIIISIANWFQKNLDVLLSTSQRNRLDSQIDEKGTKVTLLRLAVIILGFLLGVTALGISMNKLTVILGALSVGIGLGMQTIFNNFVSGVILIFEKPFKIGDFIELADKKGRVQKIGIRSSTLLTEEGSEVIIPNGDLLSGRLVNWTHSQSQYRVELNLKFNATSNLEEVKRIIKEEVAKSEYVIKSSSVEILYKSVSATDLELIIRCWVINIYKESQFKSSLLEGLRTRFTKDEISSLG